jgi:hypothetical protein
MDREFAEIIKTPRKKTPAKPMRKPRASPPTA